MYEMIAGPWHWSVSGLLIALIMFLLLYVGKEFGVSSNLRTMCTIAGAGRRTDFFRIDWRARRWNLLFVGGAVIGGFIAYYLIPNEQPLQLAPDTLAWLDRMDLSRPGATPGFTDYLPAELFAAENIFSSLGLTALLFGGFLVGFGARWAGGCTSGHAISGLSNLQLPSLIAVIGFIIGGLIMSWLILPLMLQI
jgi:uncharacterized membrane protein YedE/YeeE